MLAGVLCANLPILNALLPPRWRKGIWSRRVSPSSSNHSASPSRKAGAHSKGGNKAMGMGIKEMDSSSSEGGSERGRTRREEDDLEADGRSTITVDDVFNADGTAPPKEKMERSRRADLEGYQNRG